MPRYLLFHCIEAPLADTGGETLFTDTHALWHHTPKHIKAEWKEYSLTYETEKLAHYGGKISIPLVQTHPDTLQLILRFAEPVPAPMLNPVSVSVNKQALTASDSIIRDLTERCYNGLYCYEHSWQKNDIVIADNLALIHGRNAFKSFSPRHLRRIQIL